MKLFKSTSFKKAIEILSTEQRAELWEICFLYAENKPYNHIDQFIQLVFSQNIERFFTISEKRSNAVAVRYKKEGNKVEQKQENNTEKVPQQVSSIAKTPEQVFAENTANVFSIEEDVPEDITEDINPDEQSVKLPGEVALWAVEHLKEINRLKTITDEELLEKFLPKDYNVATYGLPALEYAKLVKQNLINSILDAIDLQKNVFKAGFQICPFILKDFPPVELNALFDTPPKFTKNTDGFWDIFATLNRKSLNNLPATWWSINTLIDRRISEIDSAPVDKPDEGITP